MSRFAEIDRLLDGARGDVFPSAQVVIADGGQIVHEAQAGAPPETLYDIASLTKPLSTTLLCMRLRIPLDDEPREKIRVRDLLSHSSGLPAWRLLGDDHQAVIRAVKETPLEYPTGTRSVYSDLGFILLGEYIDHQH